MVYSGDRTVNPADVMYAVSKILRIIRTEEDEPFDGDVGNIWQNFENQSCYFDLSVEDAKWLVEFIKKIDSSDASFKIVQEIDV